MEEKNIVNSVGEKQQSTVKVGKDLIVNEDEKMDLSSEEANMVPLHPPIVL